MLSWIFPGALWILLSAIPVLLFYFLRMRFRRQPVSSNYIWNRLRKENQKGKRFQFRSILLLILQIMIVLALTAAAAEPVLNQLSMSKPGVVFLMDASASMMTMDIASTNGASVTMKSRWEEALERLNGEIKKLPRGTEIAVFDCSAVAEKIGEADNNFSALLNKLKNNRPDESGFQETEVANGLEAWLRIRNKNWKAVLITDGGLDLGGQRISAVFNGNIQSILVGSSGEDLGVTGLRLQPDGEVNFTALNGYDSDRTARITLEKDGQRLTETGISLRPGRSRQSIKIPAPVNPGLYTIKLDGNSDSFPADDRYSLFYRSPDKIQVLLAGQDNPFLKAALSHPGIELTLVKDFKSLNADPASWDLTIADQVSIPTNWSGNMLCFNTLPPDSPVYLSIPVEGSITAVDSSHPLLRFTDLKNWNISYGNSIKLSLPFHELTARVLASVDEKPILAAWEKNGNHYAVFGIDLNYTDIGLSPSFPVFLQNYIRWCVPQSGNDLAYTLNAGETASFKISPEWKLKNEKELIKQKKIFIKRNGSMITIHLLNTGIFPWEEGLNHGFIAVNLPAGEMDLSPIPLRINKTPDYIESKPVNQDKSIVFWPLLILLVLLIAEWFFWRGRLWQVGSGKSLKKG